MLEFPRRADLQRRGCLPIVTLLPVDLILHVGSDAGFAMIFALLIAAVIWNLGTWCAGTAQSFLACADRLDPRRGPCQPAARGGTDGDLGRRLGAGEKRAGGAVVQPADRVRRRALLLLMKLRGAQPGTLPRAGGRNAAAARIRAPADLHLHRGFFFHGSNDGQKGMGLIMLILIGAAPTAYALNRTIPDSTTPVFVQTTQEAQAVFQAHARTSSPPTDAAEARATVGEALKSKAANKPEVYAALATLSADIGQQVKDYGAIKAVPAAATTNVRNDMYLASDAVRVMGAHPPGSTMRI